METVRMETASMEPKATECPVCHEYYKEPKILPCAHLLCRKCLVIWMKTNENAQCPLCRNNIRDPRDCVLTNCDELADQLPMDEIMAEMVENDKILNQNRVCYVHKDINANSFCLHCAIMLCLNCTEAHSTMPLTSSHKIENLENLTVDCMTASRQSQCCAHPEKVSALFCSTHEIFICHECAFLKHRACPEVSCINETLQKCKSSLSEMESRLTAVESTLNQVIAEIDTGFAGFEYSTKDTFTRIDAACDRLVLSIENCRKRLKKIVQDENDKLMEEVDNQKHTLVNKRVLITSHRSLINRIQLSASCTSLVSMVPRLNKRIDDLDLSTPLMSELKFLTTVKLVIDEKLLSRIDVELARLGQLVVKTPLAEQAAWQFHATHGENIILSNNGLVAELQGNYDGMVFSSEPVKMNMLYEVLVEETSVQYDGRYVGFGVVTEDPGAIPKLPMDSTGLNSAIVVYNDDIFVKRQPTPHNIDFEYKTITVGSRVGVMVDSERCCHIYVDGKDQGVVYRNVLLPCYALFDLYPFLKKVAIS